MALTTSLTIAGNLTADPELKEANGKPWVRLNIAVNPREFDRESKEWKDGEPVYWQATAFGDLAEHVAHSLSKGQRVVVYGTIKARSWTDKDSGTKRTAQSIQIEDIGPSLLYMNAVPSKNAPDSKGADDAWSSGAVSDETPF